MLRKEPLDVRQIRESLRPGKGNACRFAKGRGEYGGGKQGLACLGHAAQLRQVGLGMDEVGVGNRQMGAALALDGAKIDDRA